MNFLLALYVILSRICYYLVYPFLLRSSENQRRSVPPSPDKLLQVSASTLSELIRRKKITSEELVRAYIRRIKEVNHLINAVVEERFGKALKEAKYVDEYLRTTSLTKTELETIKPLLGVPVTIKESCMLSGMSYAVGTVVRRGIKADSDGEVVARIKMSGAIPLLVSTTPELCSGYSCVNNITGTTCNPYDVTRNSGGSSGGEAALLGAGASIIGVGSDLAGSLRFPAFCCGVFAHKPTARVVPLKGHFPLPSDKMISDYLTIGPMTRYAEDLNLLLSIMCGKQAIDLGLHEVVDLSQIRVYHMEEAPPSIINPPVHFEIKKAIRESVAFLEKNCNTKTMQDCPFQGLKNSFEFSMSAFCQLEGVPNYFKGENKNILVEMFKSMMGQSKFSFGYLFTLCSLDMRDFICSEKYSKMVEELKVNMMQELRDNGVFIYPTFPTTALKHGEFYFKAAGIGYLTPFNLMGLPATTVPCGKTSDGLPIGLQVIASPNQDRLCLAVAEELERCFGGWTPSNDPK
ncbi:hypothetical protein HHI36_012713 [Cryptolaemus montrouzieri]|uniref:Amidase domain-containing protein n=1 Tax=Cryptolaemus montrouzieri TaxID=559131 RepID=A0ABD2NF21_9CUCU